MSSYFCSGGSSRGAWGPFSPPPPPYYFQTKLKPEGRKKFLETAPPPLPQGLDDPPTTTTPRYLKVRILHCSVPFPVKPRFTTTSLIRKKRTAIKNRSYEFSIPGSIEKKTDLENQVSKKPSTKSFHLWGLPLLLVSTNCLNYLLWQDSLPRRRSQGFVCA